jgi:N-sulfoglucosamine sulfohydrolase
VYDYMRSGKIDLEPIIEAAEIATKGEEKNIDKLISFLKSDESAIRYWGATGLLILGDKASIAVDDLKNSLSDESPDVVTVAAEALYNLGEKEDAKKALLSVLNNPDEFARSRCLNTIDCINESSHEVIEGVVAMVAATKDKTRSRYDLRAAKWLIEKWKLKEEDYNIKFE